VRQRVHGFQMFVNEDCIALFEAAPDAAFETLVVNPFRQKQAPPWYWK